MWIFKLVFFVILIKDMIHFKIWWLKKKKKFQDLINKKDLNDRQIEFFKIQISWLIHTLKILLFVCIFLVVLKMYLETKTSPAPEKKIEKLVKDTLSCKGDSTEGKRILFVGDSHTCYEKGWQDQLAFSTKMSSVTVAKGGKKTDWMWQNSKTYFSKKFDYCIIWGGANDAASFYSLDSTISNIQKMIDSGNANGTKMIVLTGFNPNVINITEDKKSQWGFYPHRYRNLQEKMINELTGALIVQNWFVSRDFGDCGDFICHMTASGHKKMAEGIYSTVFLN